jgi:hypothetical protein
MTELWSSLTPAEQVALLEGHSVHYDAGCDLLDADDGFVEDISGDLVAAGSSVGRGIYRTLHGSCRLNLSRELSWGSARLRPYMLVSADGGTSTWFRQNLGVYLPSTPEREIGPIPAIWEVSAFDKLDILNTPHGSTYSVASGGGIIAAVESLITGAGEAKVAIDQTAVAVTAPAELVFPLADDATTLQIVNELLDAVGMRALQVDREGWFRSIPYRSPTNLPVVWTYNADSATTTVSESRTSISDYYQAANEIVGINDDPSNDIPTDGDGLYTLSNQSDGLTSIDGRGGRTIRRIVRGTYASQGALETAVLKVLDAESRVARLFELSVSPNPVHGHFDVVSFVDSSVPVSGRMLVTDWEMPLDGSDMRISLRGV